MVEIKVPLIPLSFYKEAGAKISGIDPVALYHNNAISQFMRDYARALDRELADYDLASGRHTSLGIISMQGAQGITPAELAERLGITRGATTGLIDSLERAGFIERRPHSVDRRMLKLHLTKAGQVKMDEYWPEHARKLCKFMNTLNKGEQRQLLELLGKLSAGFRHLTGE